MASSLHFSCIVPPLAPPSLHLSSPRTPSHRSCYHSPTLSLEHQHQHQLRHLPNSLSFISATSDGSSISALLPSSPSRSTRRANARSAAVIRAAFIFDWIFRIFKFVTATPTKLFVARLEADLNKAAKMVRTGTTVVIHIAKEADEIADEVEHFADEVEHFAEQVETVAEKVVATVDTVQEEVDDVFDVIEGEKKVVITGYQLVDNKEVTAHAVANLSTATEDKPTVSMETSIKDVSPEKSNNP